MGLSLKSRQEMEEAIEIWDDDDLDLGGDDFTFRSVSLATTTGGLSHHRDSISSRLSIRSDFESNNGDEERQLHLPGDDQSATNEAIAAATRAGIPIPQNVPSSALMGGTIKRLGGRKIKKIIQQDDWNDDLELPEPGEAPLKLKQRDETSFPDALRQVSGSGFLQPESVEPQQPSFNLSTPQHQTSKSKTGSAFLDLDRFKDDDDDDFFGDGGATIKVVKRQQKPTTVIVPPTPQKQDEVGDDDFEADFQLPYGTEPLRLSARRDIPKTPSNTHEELEWGEGSLGTRFGGTKRERSTRSSSASALSPSVSSSLTFESEDEGLDGLILPPGPLRFDDILKKRQQSQSPEHLTDDKPVNKTSTASTTAAAPANDDFLSGLEIGDGDVFDSSKLTLNRNIKVKNVRPISPQRPKAAVSLVFTNKPSPPVNSRLPRPNSGHNRLSSSLATVSESGGPIAPRSGRPPSRLGGHTAQPSITSIPTPSTPSSSHAPSTPRRRDLNQKSSINTLNQPTTTHAQLLKIKRSMPILRSNPQSPAKPPLSRYEKSPPRADANSRQTSRPKTPVERDRSGAESSMSHARKHPVPFLPAGASQSQSHHVAVKCSRHFRRNDSESSNNSGDFFRPRSRAVSRTTIRSPSPTRARLRGTEALAREAAAKRTLTRPTRRRHFGDGFELDGFDDLPTSQTVEQKFIKQPIARGAPKSLLRNKITQNAHPERICTPVPPTPSTPARSDHLPRFARDTNASRMAREQVLAQRAPSSTAPVSGMTNPWRLHLAARAPPTNFQNLPIRTKKPRQAVQQKPHLIKPMGDLSKTVKCKSSFRYTPFTY